MGLTQLHDVVYVVCDLSSTISRFSITTHERLTDIIIRDLKSPTDIAACERTSQLYVADRGKYIWQVSWDGRDIRHWRPWSDTGSDTTLSVTASQVLVTSYASKWLRLCSADGDVLMFVQLPEYIQPIHSVQSPAGTFIVSHGNTQLKWCRVSEVNAKGQILRQFPGSHLPPFSVGRHIAIDSQGNIFVADHDNRRILRLDGQLALRHVIIDERQLKNKKPHHLCYSEQSGQLLVGFYHRNSVAVFNVLH